jgi:hypothetical protein
VSCPKAGKILQIAFGFAVENGRSRLLVEDIAQARDVVESSGAKTGFGFM